MAFWLGTYQSRPEIGISPLGFRDCGESGADPAICGLKGGSRPVTRLRSEVTLPVSCSGHGTLTRILLWYLTALYISYLPT